MEANIKNVLVSPLFYCFVLMLDGCRVRGRNMMQGREQNLIAARINDKFHLFVPKIISL